jgi:hypothetical protein
MNIGLWEFITIFVLVFSLFLLIVGIFTAYFGTGKSRAIGGGLLVGGLILGLIWIILCSSLVMKTPTINVELKTLVIDSTLVLISAILGAIAAIGLFLVAIMKS